VRVDKERGAGQGDEGLRIFVKGEGKEILGK
jgi:hypothetical protein